MKLIIITLLLCAASCGNPHDPYNTMEDGNLGFDCKVVTYDTCEYVVCGGGNSQMMAHKGNCKNPIHHTDKN